MKTIQHRSTERGKANFGWLNSYHSFSFGNFYDPEKIYFGALRVLNDDTIDGGTGFGKHPHDNMEIISIPLSGALQHEDSTGTKAVIYKNDVQLMSAGTGILHAEMNYLPNEKTSFLQIWIIPKQRNITPRYAQKTFDPALYQDKLYQIVAPDNDEAVTINQDAWLSLYQAAHNNQITYNIQKKDNGVYVFVLEGKAKIDGVALHARDAMGIYETEKVNIDLEKESRVLFIDVPMQLN